jgi:hypothetical protein
MIAMPPGKPHAELGRPKAIIMRKKTTFAALKSFVHILSCNMHYHHHHNHHQMQLIPKAQAGS